MSAFVERRSQDRPKNGDTRTCPQCVYGTIEFNERYRLVEGSAAPAWVCDSPGCGHRQPVRRGDATGKPLKRRRRKTPGQ